MSEENNQQGKKKKRRFSRQQYDMLRRCSNKKDMTKWNDWRQENPSEEILLEGANLWQTHLKGAILSMAHLERADLYKANLEGAYLMSAHLESAYLNMAQMKSADLYKANLEGANLNFASLEAVNLYKANLEGADFLEANLKGASLKYADLKRTNFRRAVVDGSTVVWHCKVSRHTTEKEKYTDFSGVGINQMRINPETKQLLEYNIRRMNWLVWYKGKSPNKCIRWIRILLTSPVRLFWSMCDYGLSTGRIIGWFFGFSLLFATAYFICGSVDYYCLDIKEQPGIVYDLFTKVPAGEHISETYYSLMVYFRSIYFSIVTMTTLGFGDMHVNATTYGWRWWLGHALLMLQVLLGYVLLAALVTRFAVLFTAGGPAGKFSGEKTLPQRMLKLFRKKPTKKPPEDAPK